MAEQDKLHGVVGYYTSVDGLLAAARRIRDAGYTRWDSYSPFPVHGVDGAMGIKPTLLPWITLVMGLTGLCVGIAGQWWVNAKGYDFLISGKPTWSLPANIPVAFEVVIAFSAFTTFFAMLALNRLPRWSNPLHQLRSFDRVTSDRFAICVEAGDPSFDAGRVRQLLDGDALAGVEECPVDESPAGLPMLLHGLAAIATCLTLIPLALAYKGRHATSDKPRLHVWPDMDHQRKAKAQTASWFFRDGRSMRPPVAGAIAVGGLREDTPLYHGVETGTEWPLDVQAYNDSRPDGSPERVAEWIRGFPAAITVNDALLDRGRERYDIYCSVCHGTRGDGWGSVALRARELNGQRWGWVTPKNLMSASTSARPTGELFHISGHGISTMKGYADQVPARDRWAIVAWVRALQESQAVEQRRAPEGEYRDLPPAIRDLIVVTPAESEATETEEGGR